MRSGSRASTATGSVSSVGSSVVSPKDPAVAEVLRLRSEQLGPVWPESEVLLEQVVTAFLQRGGGASVEQPGSRPGSAAATLYEPPLPQAVVS